MKKTLLWLGISGAVMTYAADTHEKVAHIGAHVHGVAQLNIVLDGDDLDMMLESPAMNIVGFEHEPKSEEHLNQSHDALHKLKDVNEWLAISGGKCQLAEKAIDWQYQSIIVKHFHPEKAGNDEHKHDEHKHDEHKHDEHKHDEHKHKDGSAHSDIEATFAFDCQSEKEVKSITVNLFDAFPNFEKLNVQWIAGDSQGATTLTPKSRQVIIAK